MKKLKLKDVSKEEFVQFMREYPKRVFFRAVEVGEPISLVYFELDKPDKILGRVKLNEDDVRSMGRPNEYELVEK